MHDSVTMHSGLGIFGDDALRIETHEWDVCYVVSYSTVPAELYASKQMSLELYCFGLPAEPVSVTNIILPSGTVSGFYFPS